MWELTSRNRALKEEEIYLKEYKKGGEHSFLLCYPNTYSLGMSNLGFLTIYDKIKSSVSFDCDRLFLPDQSFREKLSLQKENLLSFEKERLMTDFDMVGFSISFELDYLHMLWMMDHGGIPLYAKDRKNTDPLVIGGGPCMTFNPLPLSPFLDIVVIGEGEGIILKLLDLYHRLYNGEKESFLKEAAKLEGVYVPAFQREMTGKIQKGYLTRMEESPAYSYIVTPNTEFSDMFLVEISRGCSRNCRFCMAGYCYKKPRVMPLEKVKELILKGKPAAKRVGLVGAAISDYPYIDELTTFLMEEEIPFSVASLRADSLTETLVRGLKASGHKTITIAPEAGSPFMRDVIHKNITEEDVLRAVDMAVAHEIYNIKMYFIIGLPKETKKDIEAIVDLVLRVRKNPKVRKLSVSINPFIPKPFTPFQWEEMETEKELEEKLKYIVKCLKKGKNIEVDYESPKWAKVQSILARGTEKTADLLVRVYENGEAIGSFKKGIRGYLEETAMAEKEKGAKDWDILTRGFSTEEPLPWDKFDMGLPQGFLWGHRQKSLEVK